MNLLSKIRDFINEILLFTMDLIDNIWSFLFSSDKSPEKSKEFEASIIIDDRQDEQFISKENIPNTTEYLSDEEHFEASIIDDRQDDQFISKENIPNTTEYLSDEEQFEFLSNDTDI